MKNKKKKTEPTLTETLKQAILDSDLTTYAIAKRAGVAPGVLTRFINGERGLFLDTASKVAPVLGLRLVEDEDAKAAIEPPRKPGRPPQKH